MNIKILGMGCMKCQRLYELVEKVVKEKGIEATIEKVEKFNEIMKYRVMITPALVVNEKVVLSGTIPTEPELEKLIERVTK